MIGRTPLVYAVVSENAAVVKYLLDHGADPNKVDDDGLAPLHSAAGIGLSNSLISLCFTPAPHFLNPFLYDIIMWQHSVLTRIYLAPFHSNLYFSTLGVCEAVDYLQI